MPSLSDIANSIKNKISDPKMVLLNLPPLKTPLVIDKMSVLSYSKAASKLYVLNCPSSVYISTAFNNGFDLEAMDFKKLIFKKFYDSIYFDFDVEI